MCMCVCVFLKALCKVCVCVCVCVCVHCDSSTILQASKEAVVRELEERLKAKCLRVVQWYSEGTDIGIVCVCVCQIVT